MFHNFAFLVEICHQSHNITDNILIVVFRLPNWQTFFRDLEGWREKHSELNESGGFLIETCDESVVLELEESLLLLNRRWKEICDGVEQSKQAHTSGQRAKEFEQGVCIYLILLWGPALGYATRVSDGELIYFNFMDY